MVKKPALDVVEFCALVFEKFKNLKNFGSNLRWVHILMGICLWCMRLGGRSSPRHRRPQPHTWWSASCLTNYEFKWLLQEKCCFQKCGHTFRNFLRPRTVSLPLQMRRPARTSIRDPEISGRHDLPITSLLYLILFFLCHNFYSLVSCWFLVIHWIRGRALCPAATAKLLRLQVTVYRMFLVLIRSVFSLIFSETYLC